MPVAFLSKPSVARLSVSVSVSRDAANCVEEAFRAWARVKREEVRFADSVSLAVMMVAWVGDGERGVVGSGGAEVEGWRRLRRVDDGSEGGGDCVGGSEGVWFWAGDGSGGASSPRMSSPFSGPLRRSSSSPWASMSWSRSVSRLMRARWAKRSDWVAFLFEGCLMKDEECSRRRRRVRAYSSFYSVSVSLQFSRACPCFM